jgi:hypothetical protein
MIRNKKERLILFLLASFWAVGLTGCASADAKGSGPPQTSHSPTTIAMTTAQVQEALVELKFQDYHAAAVEAGLSAEDRAWVDKKIGEIRKLINQAFEENTGRDAGGQERFTIEVILAATSRLQTALGIRPQIAGALAEPMARKELIKLALLYAPQSLERWVLEAKPTAPAQKILKTTIKQARDQIMAAHANAMKKQPLAQTFKNQQRMEEAVQSVQQSLHHALTAAQYGTLNQILHKQLMGGIGLHLRLIQSQERFNAKNKVPAEALVSSGDLESVAVAADGRYQLLATGEDEPLATVQLKQGERVGFIPDQTGIMRLVAVGGKDTFDIPGHGKTFYWKAAKGE